MTDVKTVLEQLIQKTKAGTIPWREVGDGRGELQGYKAVSGDVVFDLLYDPHQFRINGAIVDRAEGSVWLMPLGTAISQWIRQSRTESQEQEVQRALEMAAKVLR